MSKRNIWKNYLVDVDPLGKDGVPVYERRAERRTETMKEEQTILLAREGSLDALHELFKSHWPRIWRIALRYTGSGPDAEDIMQETFIRAFEKLHTFKFHKQTTFASWLNTICINCTMDFLRRQKRKRHHMHHSIDDLTLEPVSSNPNPAQSVEAELVGTKIQESLECLSPRQRIIFDLRFNQQMDIRDIAECLRCSTSNIKTQIYRSLQKLRKTLEPIWGKS